MKTTLIPTVIVLLALTAPISAYSETAGFKDMQGHWAQAAVEKLALQHIVDGVSEDLFAPDRHVTRAEFVNLLGRAFMGALQGTGKGSSFRDVKPDDWFASYIEEAARLKLVDGFEDGAFRPNALINREEMTALIVRFASHYGAPPKVPDNSQELFRFTDRNQIQWAHDELAVAVHNGFLEGRTPITLEPLSFSTRAEAVTMIDKLLKWVSQPDFSAWNEERVYAFLHEVLAYTSPIIRLTYATKEEIAAKYQAYFTPELSMKIVDSLFEQTNEGWKVPDGDGGYLFTVPERGEQEGDLIDISIQPEAILFKATFEMGMYSLIQYTIQDAGNPRIADWIKQ